MRFLGVDYGAKRIGVAVSDEAGLMAFPRAVVLTGPKAASAISKLAQETGATRVVMGESRNYRGEQNVIAAAAKKFAEQLAAAGLGVDWEPEFLTSAQAERLQGKTAEHDASAAALILKTYLERRARLHGQAHRPGQAHQHDSTP